MYRYLVMDVDGTLTDGKIYLFANGDETKAFDVKDGYAIANMLPLMEIEPVIITGRESAIVERRAAELGIHRVYQGVKDKTACLEALLVDENASMSNVVYVGDDVNDLPCMLEVKTRGGFIACPADAASQVRTVSDFVSERDGGCGAVRELVDMLWDKFVRGEI